jgi:hypothetical protein
LPPLLLHLLERQPLAAATIVERRVLEITP